MRRKHFKGKDSVQIEILFETMDVIKEMCEDWRQTNFGVFFYLRDPIAVQAFWTKMAERGILESDIQKNVSYLKKPKNIGKVRVYLW